MKFFILLSFLFIGANCGVPPPDCNSVTLYFIGTNLTDVAKVTLTTGSELIRGSKSNLFSPITYKKYYDPTKRTVLYTNGWRSNFESEDAQLILGNYVAARRSEYNIVYLDWSPYTDNFVYITSVGAIPGVSKNIKVNKQNGP